MEIQLRRADPAGNITLLIETPVPAEDRAEVAGALLARQELGAEQVGFLVPALHGGAVRLEMMGGEFCGNALRSAGYLLALQQNKTDSGVFSIEISGTEELLQVRADISCGEATAQMPLPCGMDEIDLCGRQVGLVMFHGIVHAIADECRPDREWADRAARELAGRYHAEAAGVMFLYHEADELRLEPAVYVAATDTLCFERSCASGSAAALVYLSEGGADGVYAYTFHEPGGIIRASMICLDSDTSILTVGGPVCMDRQITICL